MTSTLPTLTSTMTLFLPSRGVPMGVPKRFEFFLIQLTTTDESEQGSSPAAALKQ